MMPNDLIARAQQGDSAALSQLYTEHIRQVYRFVFYKVGNKEDTEDLVQEVFIAAFAGLKNFRGDSSFRNWCYEIAKRKIADMWRQKYQMPTTDIEAILGVETAVTMELADERAAQEAHEAFKSNQVENVLARLKDNYREVLEYRFLKNYSIKETAAAMHISVNNAKILQHRALKAAASLGEEALHLNLDGEKAIT